MNKYAHIPDRVRADHEAIDTIHCDDHDCEEQNKLEQIRELLLPRGDEPLTNSVYRRMTRQRAIGEGLRDVPGSYYACRTCDRIGDMPHMIKHLDSCCISELLEILEGIDSPGNNAG